MARADKGMGGGVAGGNAGPNGTQAPGKPAGEGLSEGDLANDTMGDAGAQGPSDMKGGKDDLLSNTRVDQAGPQPEPDDGPLESFAKMDKDVRASEDLGKGNRYSDDHPKNDKPEEGDIELGDAPDTDGVRVNRPLS